MNVIKKYGNRRLYCMTRKKYITYREVCRDVRRRIPLKVLDHVSGRDVTLRTMAQVLAEHPGLRGERMCRKILDLVRAI